MTLETFLRRVVESVESVDIPYMLTGSLAAAYYANPRATRDVDLVIAVSLDSRDGRSTGSSVGIGPSADGSSSAAVAWRRWASSFRW